MPRTAHTVRKNADLPIWLRPARGARGPTPAYDRGAIAAAAVTLADQEGLEAVSMRRVAKAIGTGATALYRYVADKDELFELMSDAVMSRSPPKRTGKWRPDLRALAERLRATMLRHPWLAELSAFRPTLGPNGLRWLEAMFAALDGHDLAIDDVVVLASTTMVFVRGYVADELADDAALRRTGLTADDWMRMQADYGATIFASDAYPNVTRVMREARGPHAADRRDRGFTLGLECVLDGVAARIPRRKTTRK